MKLVMIRSCVNRVRSALATLLVSATLFGQALHSAAAAEVEILRDPWGIPHVFAAAESDGFFGLGYAAAEDRLLQMELIRRKAAGREALDDLQPDLVGKLRDVVEKDVDRRLGGQRAEVVFDALLADLEVIRAGDRDRAVAQVGKAPASLKHQINVRLGRPGQNRHASACLVGDDFDHSDALLEAQADELARAAVGIKAGDAHGDQP
jgi:hypothetical protein